MAARIPLDDVLGMAEACAQDHMTERLADLYMELETAIIGESAGWDLEPAAKKAVLETYIRAYKNLFIAIELPRILGQLADLRSENRRLRERLGIPDT